jgi:hypothetical protein
VFTVNVVGWIVTVPETSVPPDPPDPGLAIQTISPVAETLGVAVVRSKLRTVTDPLTAAERDVTVLTVKVVGEMVTVPLT